MTTRCPLTGNVCASAEDHGGWKNRETWQANLWISNDEGLYHLTRGLDASSLADTVSDWIGDLGGTQGILGDITGLWMQRVDWDALAAAYAEDAE